MVQNNSRLPKRPTWLYLALALAAAASVIGAVWAQPVSTYTMNLNSPVSFPADI